MKIDADSPLGIFLIVLIVLIDLIVIITIIIGWEPMMEWIKNQLLPT